MQQKAFASIELFIGFMLSPLSWWNDLLINIPLSYVFSFPFSLVSPRLFIPSFIAGYFLTNVLGFVLMHRGTRRFRNEAMGYNAKTLKKEVLISGAYCLLILILAIFGIIKPPTEFMH